jgi:hypothetical protein
MVPCLPTTLPPLIIIHQQSRPRYRGFDHVDSLSGKSSTPPVGIFLAVSLTINEGILAPSGFPT